MNILFFLIPKKEVEYVYDTFTIRQTMEKMDFHHYTAIPIINKEGEYVGTISDGDILRFLKNNNLDWELTMKVQISSVEHFKQVKPISIDKDISDLIPLIINQNFVPLVDDENHFIGIITRKTIINYISKYIKE